MKKKSGVFDKQDRLARLVKVQQMVAGSPASITVLADPAQFDAFCHAV